MQIEMFCQHFLNFTKLPTLLMFIWLRMLILHFCRVLDTKNLIFIYFLNTKELILAASADLA